MTIHHFSAPCTIVYRTGRVVNDKVVNNVVFEMPMGDQECAQFTLTRTEAKRLAAELLSAATADDDASMPPPPLPEGAA